MPRFFFDIHDGVFVHDDTGTECPDADAARREARRALPDIARDILPNDGDHHTLTVTVRNEQGATVYKASLTFEALPIDQPDQG